MARDLVMAAILFLLGMFAACAEIPNAEQTRTDFEKLSAELPYLCVSSVLYDNPNQRFAIADIKKKEAHFNVLNKVTDRVYTKEVLLPLLTHENEKVRTLAAVALFNKEDPSVLPFLAKLCGDKAQTFAGYPELSATWLLTTGVGLPTEKQTVGDIVMQMLSLYMKLSGYYYGVTPTNNRPGFAEYWEARRDRSYCAAWFAVQLTRACRGTRPTPKDCFPRIRKLREQIDKLPADDRAWILLWLNGESGSDALVTEEELVAACKSIGSDKLLLMLQDKIPCDDPDLQSRPDNNWPYKRMTLFVLRHAEQMLRRSDRDALLACEQWQRDYQQHGTHDPTITAWWPIAAASVAPVDASIILHTSMGRFQGKYESSERSALCAAMWRLCGKSEMNFIVNWFFEESPERGRFPNARASFIEVIAKGALAREIVAQLITDKRLDNLDWQTLERLVRVVNVWTGTPIVTEEEIHEVWHPFGQGHYDWQRDEAKKNFPKETEELEKHLNVWRTRLRKSIPKWLEKDGR